jgi:hypothetical protein
MLPANKRPRQVILADAEYFYMREAARRQHRTFSNWAAAILRRALFEDPVGHANASKWEG